MAISVTNQFYLSFTITNPSSGQVVEDFIDVNDLDHASFFEEVGHVMPTFELAFQTANELVFGLLHEGSSIAVQFGQSSAEASSYTLYVTKVNSKELGFSRRLFRCVGISVPITYVSNLNRKVIGPFSGIEGVQQIVESDGFTVDSNLTKSADSQYWVQANWSDRKFVSEMCKHSFIQGSFIVAALTSDMTFIIRDVRALAKGGQDSVDRPAWIFTAAPASGSETEILYDPDTDYETNTGFINYWMGYGQQLGIFSLEDQDLSIISEDVRPVIALTNSLARRAGLQARYQGTAMQNENTHDNYWLAALQNTTNAAVFGSIKLTLNFHAMFYDVRPLDLVTFVDSSIQQVATSSSKATSGYYIVSKISRTVRDKKLTSTVTLCRESLNDITGDVSAAGTAIVPTAFGVAGTLPDMAD